MKLSHINYLILSVFLLLFQLDTCWAGKNIPPIQTQLISSQTHVGSNDSLEIGLEFMITKGWKLYTKMPPGEDAPAFGQEPEIEWTHLDNAEIIDIEWPEGIWRGEGIYKTYAYEKTTIIPITLKILDKNKPITVKARVNYFACAEMCRPFEDEVTLSLKPGISKKTQAASLIDNFEGSAEEIEKAHNIQEFTELIIMVCAALLGGFILNFMPCVLPVLSLKIMGLIKSHHPNFKQKFAATALGILSSFFILSLIIVLFRSVGISVGWGFQFQEPIFIGVMMLITLAFALNLFGLFEIMLPEKLNHLMSFNSQGLKADFLTGILAAVLATPCSAPFLGSAITYALTKDTFEIILLFTCLGIGFSLPYWVAILLPEKYIKLPHPGEWMNTLRKALGALMLATSIWLGFVLYEELQEDLAIAQFHEELGIKWYPFSQELLKKSSEDGRIVFIDITAKWCVTCHLNKSIVLKNPNVLTILKSDSVVCLRGDWTKKDPEIKAFLAKYMRFGIPFNGFFTKDNQTLLSELLTESDVIAAYKNIRK